MFFITTAIDYTNSIPHFGHAYEKVLTDVITRYRRLKGDNVYFLTGVDQHGQKVQQSAEKEGIHPAVFAKETTKNFLKLWELLGVEYDGWAETTADVHKACVQKILIDLKDKGQLYKKAYTGFYSVRQEQFLTDKERDESGNFGPEWGEVVELSEENWYFKLSDHAAWLREFVEKNDNFIIPAFRKAEVLNAIDRASDSDLCITRPKERLHWGIEVPFDPDFVVYVWFDALINYISFAGYNKDAGSELPDFKTLWSNTVHVIGKDILVPPHAIYWPCMLHAMGFSDDEMPTLLVHGFWNSKKVDASGNVSSEKMSKSLGNVLDPLALSEKFSVDAVRYYMVRDINTGQDSDTDVDRLVMLFNTELANNFGNLLNRSLNMTNRFADNIVDAAGYDDELSAELREQFAKCVPLYCEAMDAYKVSDAIKHLVDFLTACNIYAEKCKPWELAKDESNKPRIKGILAHMTEASALASVLLSPILPDSAKRIQAQLNAEHLGTLKLANLKWGVLPTGHQIGKATPVFPRIDAAALS